MLESYIWFLIVAEHYLMLNNDEATLTDPVLYLTQAYELVSAPTDESFLLSRPQLGMYPSLPVERIVVHMFYWRSTGGS